MTFHERKCERKKYYFRFEYRHKMVGCVACAGSGYYDHNGSPPCGECDGRGKVVRGTKWGRKDLPQEELKRLSKLAVDYILANPKKFHIEEKQVSFCEFQGEYEITYPTGFDDYDVATAINIVREEYESSLVDWDGLAKGTATMEPNYPEHYKLMDWVASLEFICNGGKI